MYNAIVFFWPHPDHHRIVFAMFIKWLLRHKCAVKLTLLKVSFLLDQCLKHFTKLKEIVPFDTVLFEERNKLMYWYWKVEWDLFAVTSNEIRYFEVLKLNYYYIRQSLTFWAKNMMEKICLIHENKHYSQSQSRILLLIVLKKILVTCCSFWKKIRTWDHVQDIKLKIMSFKILSFKLSVVEKKRVIRIMKKNLLTNYNRYGNNNIR